MMWKLIAILAATVAVAMYVTKKTCTIKCGSSVNRENMTAGLGTINGLSFYDNSRVCYGGNAEGSSSPFCTNTGYVLT